MAYIRVIDENEAEGDLFTVYDEVQRSRGRLSNILQVQSLDPKGLKAHLDLYMTLVYGKGPLPRRERELLALVVSVANECEYCIVHHTEALGAHLKDEKLVRRLAKDPVAADVPQREKALVSYAWGLTRTPGEAREEAVQVLREAGLDDTAILQATEIVAYFNFVNRLASGLGVALEQEEMRDYAY